MEPEIEAAFQMSYPDFKKGLLHSAYRKGANLRPRMKILFAFAFLCFMYSLCLLLINGFRSGYWILYFFSSLFFLFMPSIFHLSLIGSIKAYYWEYKSKEYQFKYGFTQNAMHQEKIGKAERVQAEYGYDSFSMAVETQSAFILYVLEIDTLYIPKQSIVKGTPKGLRELLKSKLGGKYFGYSGGT